MGILKNIVRAKVSGNVGSMNFRERGSQVVVAERSYKNASKGSGASYKQRKHRCRMSNVCNFFQKFATICEGLFEDKTRYVSYYNLFNKYNLSRSNVFLTKDMAEKDASIPAGYIISRGSLKSVGTTISSGGFYVSGIAVPESFDLQNNTIASLASAIKANNSFIKEGDVIALVTILGDNFTVLGETIPSISASKAILPIDSANLNSISTLEISAQLCITEGHLSASNNNQLATAFVLMRPAVGAVSTECLTLSPTGKAVNKIYSSNSAIEAAMNSYGFKGGEIYDGGTLATITSIKYGANDLAYGASIDPGHQLVITGTDLNNYDIKVSVGGTVYVPTASSSTSVTYSLDSEGTLCVYVNDSLYMTAVITGSTAQAYTSFKIGTNTYTATKSNLTLANNTSFDCTITTDAGTTVTATGATLRGQSKVGGVISFQMSTPATWATPWTLSLDGVVFASGYTDADPDDDPLSRE